MAANKKTPAAKADPSGGLNLNKLMDAATKDVTRNVAKTSDVMKDWRWIDFWDFERDRPCLPMEHFFGSRGLLLGRVVNWKGEEHAGKSAISVYVNACAQRGNDGKGNGAYTIIQETEGVDAPPHFLSTLGVDPSLSIRERPTDVQNCMGLITTWLDDIRGTPKKAGVDTDCVYPIVMTVDSVSNLSGTSNVKSEHSIAFSKFFRDDLGRLEGDVTLLQLTAQIKQFFKIGFGASNGPQKTDTFIAEGAIKFLSTWICRVKHSKLYDADMGGDYGEVVELIPEKNKLASRKGKRIKLHLIDDMKGRKCRWDFEDANIQLFLKSKTTLPADEWQCKGSSGWYRHSWVMDGKALKKDEFIDAIYEDEALLNRIRERLQILGFGFDFESNFDLEAQEIADLKNLDEEEVVDGE